MTVGFPRVPHSTSTFPPVNRSTPQALSLANGYKEANEVAWGTWSSSGAEAYTDGSLNTGWIPNSSDGRGQMASVGPA